ncbi:MAG TPA: hypothetical protein VIK91_00505 [Nannocystis sp.]
MSVFALATGCSASTAEDDTMTAGTTAGTTESGSTATGSTTGDPTQGGTAEPTTGEGPSGACVLEGLFEECKVGGVAGVAYCDVIGGELKWGPCVTNPACELNEPLVGCQVCTLVEGVPTIEGSPTCSCEGPENLPVCSQTECLQRWEYSCGDCWEFTSGDCFSYSEGCSSPWLGCGLESPCSRVWAFSEDWGVELNALEDEEAAICVLTAIRDGTVGTYQILWGPMDDVGAMYEYVHVHGDGTATVEWRFVCGGCINSGALGRSGALHVQPASWFDDCLSEPTTENLIKCTVGLTEYHDSPPPEDFVPPFTSGECASLEPKCP